MDDFPSQIHHKNGWFSQKAPLKQRVPSHFSMRLPGSATRPVPRRQSEQSPPGTDWRMGMVQAAITFLRRINGGKGKTWGFHSWNLFFSSPILRFSAEFEVFSCAEDVSSKQLCNCSRVRVDPSSLPEDIKPSIASSMSSLPRMNMWVEESIDQLKVRAPWTRAS